MPESCRKRQIRASNGLEEEEYELVQLVNESEMTSQHLGSFSSNGCSKLKLDIARCRSLESFMGRVAAAGYPQEVVLVQMNLKLRERLRFLCKCKDLTMFKPCDLHQCPNIKQRLEKHRKDCHGMKKCKPNACKEEGKNVIKLPSRIFMFDKSNQTTEVKRINDASTNWECLEQKQKMTSPQESLMHIDVQQCKRICNSASTMATIDCLRKTQSTMAMNDATLRHTQSCNTTVSFKNFYKDRLQYEVLQWLREVPIVAEFNSSTRVATEKTVNNLIDAIYKLSAKANCDTYECKLYGLITACLEALPVSYHSVKCDKTKRVLIESLITRIMVLNNRYIFSTSNTSCTMPSFYPCGFNDFATYSSTEEISEAPLTKSYRKDIHDWVNAKKFKRKDGKAINKAEVTERLLDRLIPILYDKQAKNTKYLIRGGIIEILAKYSLAFTGSNNRLYLDDLATELATILLKTRSGYKPTTKSSTVSNSFKNFFSNPKNFLHNLRKRNTVKINDSKETPALNSKNFFRRQRPRRVTIVLNEMKRCYTYYASRKVSDMWFELVKIDFHELTIMCAITNTLLKLVAVNSLYMALKINNIISQSEIRAQDLDVTYNYIFMCWIINTIMKEYKIRLNNSSIHKHIKSKPLGCYKEINKPKSNEIEKLHTKMLCTLTCVS